MGPARATFGDSISCTIGVFGLVREKVPRIGAQFDGDFVPRGMRRSSAPNCPKIYNKMSHELGFGGILYDPP